MVVVVVVAAAAVAVAAAGMGVMMTPLAANQVTMMMTTIMGRDSRNDGKLKGGDPRVSVQTRATAYLTVGACHSICTCVL